MAAANTWPRDSWPGPAPLPAARAVALLYPASTVAALLLFGFVLLLTPTGIAALAPLALVGQGHGGRATAAGGGW